MKKKKIKKTKSVPPTYTRERGVMVKERIHVIPFSQRLGFKPEMEEGRKSGGTIRMRTS